MNQKELLNGKENGITLIALVITIIVLLILAGVAISMLSGDNGILKQAADAKTETELKTEAEQVKLAAMAALTAGEGNFKSDKALEILNQELAKIEGYNAGEIKKEDLPKTITIGDNSYKIEEKGTVEEITSVETEGLTRAEVATASNNKITEATDGMIKEIKTFSDGIVPIPTKFEYVTGDKVDDGIVVKDEYENEFVWVPVDGANVKVELNQSVDNGVSTGQEISLSDEVGQLDATKMGNITEEQYKKEYDDMIESVRIYGGFYVGRYETSWTGTKVASVQNVQPMHSNTPVDDVDSDLADGDGKGASWYTYYNKQKALHAGSSSVVSGMIYGSQWDAIMAWMKDVPNVDDTSKKYINDSTGMGHYSYDDKGNVIAEEKPLNTGSNSRYSVKNIFDLAGNCSEYTRELSAGLISHRGGSYMHSYVDANASSRFGTGPNLAFMDFNTSRLQLHIK